MIKGKRTVAQTKKAFQKAMDLFWIYHPNADDERFQTFRNRWNKKFFQASDFTSIGDLLKVENNA